MEHNNNAIAIDFYLCVMTYGILAFLPETFHA